MAGTPSHRAFGIIDLGRNSRQVFGFKGLTGKVFWNKDLSCQRALKMGFGAASRAVFGYGAHLKTAPIRGILSHGADWESVMAVQMICDEKSRSLGITERESQIEKIDALAEAAGMGCQRQKKKKLHFRQTST